VSAASIIGRLFVVVCLRQSFCFLKQVNGVKKLNPIRGVDLPKHLIHTRQARGILKDRTCSVSPRVAQNQCRYKVAGVLKTCEYCLKYCVPENCYGFVSDSSVQSLSGFIQSLSTLHTNVNKSSLSIYQDTFERASQGWRLRSICAGSEGLCALLTVLSFSTETLPVEPRALLIAHWWSSRTSNIGTWFVSGPSPFPLICCKLFCS
jgi:hypothetical protein